MEERLANLSTENAALQRANAVLLKRVGSLEAGNATTYLTDSTPAHKRRKHESGVTIVYDSSESAVFAFSLQMEFFRLAAVTTALCLIFVETMRRTCSVEVHHEAGATMAVDTLPHSATVATLATHRIPRCLSTSKMSAYSK